MLRAAGEGTAFRGGSAEFPEVGVLALEGGLLGSGVARGDSLLHASLLRGAASGALAGRPASGGDLPGGPGVPASKGSSGSTGSTKDGETSGGSGSSGPSSSGSGESPPQDAPPSDERPR